MVNPEYSLTQKQATEKYKKATEKVSKLCFRSNLVETIIGKITQQWKSVKTAFTKINCEKSGYIEKDELRMALNNWGLDLDEEKFNRVYDAFDLDKDGLIGYNDFKRTIGEKIQPEEFLYFRQDNPSTFLLNPVEQKNCWKELPKVFCFSLIFNRRKI